MRLLRNCIRWKEGAMIELRKCLKYEWAWCDGDCEHCQAVFTTGIVPPYIQEQFIVVEKGAKQ